MWFVACSEPRSAAGILSRAVVFLLMGLLCVGAMVDNSWRAEARASCRRAMNTPEGYAVLILGNTSHLVTPEMVAQTEAALGFPPKECGYDGLPIRPFPAEKMREYQGEGFPWLRSTIGARSQQAL